jgi:hypothetical protein
MRLRSGRLVRRSGQGCFTTKPARARSRESRGCACCLRRSSGEAWIRPGLLLLPEAGLGQGRVHWVDEALTWTTPVSWSEGVYQPWLGVLGVPLFMVPDNDLHRCWRIRFLGSASRTSARVPHHHSWKSLSVNLHFQFIATTVLWLDLLSILLLCVNLVELVQICFVLMSWILSASRSEFYILCCIIKLFLGHINFLTSNK